MTSQDGVSDEVTKGLVNSSVEFGSVWVLTGEPCFTGIWRRETHARLTGWGPEPPTVMPSAFDTSYLDHYQSVCENSSVGFKSFSRI